VLGQAGGGRLHAHKLIGGLRAVAQRQLGLGIQFARLLHHFEQAGKGNLAQDFAGPLGLAHVALDQAAIGPAHLGQHLAGGKVHDLVNVQALVWFTPAQHGDVDHGKPQGLWNY
jgi:hypothetical protein